MREVTSHQGFGSGNAALKIEADDPGPGGASHTYKISGFSRKIDIGVARQQIVEVIAVTLDFQNGAIKEAGVNGITHEALIAILLDRLCSFQNGPYQCEENADAIKYLILARAALGNRTANRSERGVEGTMKV